MFLQLFVVSRLIKMGWHSGRSHLATDHCPGDLWARTVATYAASGAIRKDLRERLGLLGQQDNAEHVVSTHFPRREIQGQPGHQQLFSTGRRRRLGPGCFCRRQVAGARCTRIRLGQYCVHPRVVLSRPRHRPPSTARSKPGTDPSSQARKRKSWLLEATSLIATSVTNQPSTGDPCWTINSI